MILRSVGASVIGEAVGYCRLNQLGTWLHSLRLRRCLVGGVLHSVPPSGLPCLLETVTLLGTLLGSGFYAICTNVDKRECANSRSGEIRVY